jgi:hypothetical protein
MMRKNFLILAMVLTASSIPALPMHQWRSFATTHFIVCYNEKTSGFASSAAELAERIFDEAGPSIDTNLQSDLKNRKIAIVLSDDSEDPNGLAMTDHKLIEVYCRRGSLFGRGDHDWMRTVLSHELGHIFTYMNRPISLRILLGGNASVIGPGSGITLGSGLFLQEFSPPAWYTEGVAQYTSELFGADERDPYREMLLGDAFRYSRLLPVQSLARFEGNGRDNEMVYNQGYDIVRMLARSRGFVGRLNRSIFNYGFPAGFRAATGRTPDQFYALWKSSLKDRFSLTEERVAPVFVHPRKRRDFVTETGLCSGGAFTIANWNHDYERLDLFIRSGRSTHVIRDVGPRICRDRKTGDIYYASSRYSLRFGTGVFDIRKYRAGAPDPLITRESRAMAFDSLDGTLYYASYDAGTNRIVRLSPGKPQEILRTFKRGTSVDSIAVLSEGKLLLSLAYGNRLRAYLLDNGTLVPLWENVVADIRDVFAYDDQTVFFCSTLEGSPRVYRADIGTPDLWFRLSGDASSLPVVETEDGHAVLYHALYRDGSQRFVRAGDAFDSSRPVDIKSIPDAPQPAVPNLPVSALKSSDQATLPSFIDPVMFGITYRYDDDGADKFPTIGGMIDLSYFNAPRTFSGWTHVEGEYPFHKDDPYKLSDAYGNTGISFAFLQARVSLSLTGQLMHSDFGYSNEMIGYRIVGFNRRRVGRADASLYLDIGLHHGAEVFFFIEGQNATYQEDLVIPGGYWRYGSLEWKSVYSLKAFGADWAYYRNVQSRQVSGGLPQGADRFWIRGFRGSLDYPLDFWGPSYVPDKPPYKVSFLESSASSSRLFFGNRISAALTAQGFGWFVPGSPERTVPIRWPILGGEDYFSGFPQYHFPSRAAGWMTAEIRVAPFRSARLPLHWYERFGLGVKIEAGAAEYKMEGTKTSFPVSLETAIRQEFHFGGERLSLFYVKFALPLRQFATVEKGPDWTAYCGLTVNYRDQTATARPWLRNKPERCPASP